VPHPIPLDETRWSGDGSFTQLLVAALRDLPGIAALRVEDAPSSRADAGYNFIANEIFVTFAEHITAEHRRWLGLIPYERQVLRAALGIEGLPALLARDPAIGEPDYRDESMIQYLRTERVVAPYQRRGIKVVEMVRIYRIGTPSR
jgi:hypothetical protein